MEEECQVEVRREETGGRREGKEGGEGRRGEGRRGERREEGEDRAGGRRVGVVSSPIPPSDIMYTLH